MSKAKNNEVTSPRVAKIASEQLSKPSTPKPAKSTAASALTQAADKSTKPKSNKKR